MMMALIAVLLLIPATAASGEPYNTTGDQEVIAGVMPADTLAIEVEQQNHFWGLVTGGSEVQQFHINVLNTTVDGWEVTVTPDMATANGDLWRFDWTCDDMGNCWDPVPTDPPATIAKSSVVVEGGDLDWWDGEDPTGDTVRPMGGPLVDGALTVVQATSYAYGGFFNLDNPWSTITINVPGDTEPGQYRQVLTYTITSWNPTG
jgi:hypothetical protein